MLKDPRATRGDTVKNQMDRTLQQHVANRKLLVFSGTEISQTPRSTGSTKRTRPSTLTEHSAKSGTRPCLTWRSNYPRVDTPAPQMYEQTLKPLNRSEIVFWVSADDVDFDNPNLKAATTINTSTQVRDVTGTAVTTAEVEDEEVDSGDEPLKGLTEERTTITMRGLRHSSNRGSNDSVARAVGPMGNWREPQASLGPDFCIMGHRSSSLFVPFR